MTLLPKSFILTNLVRNGLSNAARPLYATSAVRSVTSNSSNSAVAQEDENENSEFAKDYKNKVKFLERFGLIKPNISWPQYNRIIYPPSENGELMRNPVRSSLKDNIRAYLTFKLSLNSSLFITCDHLSNTQLRNFGTRLFW